MRFRFVLAALCVLVLAAAFTAAATADDDDGDGPPGFQTLKEPLLECPGCRTNGVIPIISVGDQPENGYMFEAIPDGISLIGGGDDDDDDFRSGRSDDDDDDDGGGLEILVNHELSLVPFGGVGNTRQDPTNSIVGRITLNDDAEVVRSSIAVPSSAGFQRFCSNFLVDREHGFRRPLLFTNEEARDIVLRQEESWHTGGVSLSETGAEQAGVVVAYDVRNGTFKSIYGMGRHNHENSVALPGRRPVILSGDDTFDAPASQLYMYRADSGQDVWDDKGKLYAFVSDNSAINDYGDITATTPPVNGHFIEVPLEIATGKDKDDGSEVTSADFGYPAPGAATPPTPNMPDGPQWVLEHWSNINNVFQFIRIEDTAYDRRNSRVMYMADTGEPRAVAGPNNRLMRGGSTTKGDFMNGRLWRLELGRDPLVAGGVKLSILPNANFDLNGYASANSPHQPDNMETTRNAIYFQEDPGAHNSSAAGTGTLSHFPPFQNATNARIWRYDLRTGALRFIAEVDQTVTGAPTTLAKGTWESSGIVDASDEFGRGAFLVDIQAHQWDVPTGPAGQNRQREQGQLLLIKVRDP